MAHPPDARETADADSSAAVGVHTEAGREAEVQGNGGYAHAFRGTLDDACQLGPPPPELSAIVFC
eukprot:6061566-Alexandrium_andersonii.AAC.1